MRNDFIVLQCIGAYVENNELKYLDMTGVDEELEEICALAEDKYLKIIWAPDSATKAACSQLVQCIITEKLKLDWDEETYKPFFYDTCKEKSVQELQQNYTSCMEGDFSDDDGGGGGGGGDNTGGCFKHHCPPAIQDYFRKYYIEPRQPTNSFSHFGSLFGLKVAELVVHVMWIAAYSLYEILPFDNWWVFSKIPMVAAEGAKQALDWQITKMQEGINIDEGEGFESVYESTRQLIDAGAAIFGEAACKCNDKNLYGYGCDSIDNDCDDVVDECQEEKIPPEIYTHRVMMMCSSQAKDDVWFADLPAAENCVKQYLVVEDDCDSSPHITITSSGSCHNGKVSITATDKCENTVTIRNRLYLAVLGVVITFGWLFKIQVLMVIGIMSILTMLHMLIVAQCLLMSMSRYHQTKWKTMLMALQTPSPYSIAWLVIWTRK